MRHQHTDRFKEVHETTGMGGAHYAEICRCGAYRWVQHGRVTAEWIQGLAEGAGSVVEREHEGAVE